MPPLSSSTGTRSCGYGSRTGLGIFGISNRGRALEIIDPHTVRVTLQVLNEHCLSSEAVLNHLDQPAEEQGGSRVFRHQSRGVSAPRQVRAESVY